MANSVSKNIRRIRQEKGMSQDRLSKKADLALNTIVKVETGENPNPTVETLKKTLKHWTFQSPIYLRNNYVKQFRPNIYHKRRKPKSP